MRPRPKQAHLGTQGSRMKTRQGQAGAGEGQPVGKEFWMKVGQRLHSRGQNRAGPGRAGATRSTRWGRPGTGTRMAVAGVGLTGAKRLEQGCKQKSHHTHGADCERVRGPPRSGVRRKQSEKELEEKKNLRGECEREGTGGSHQHLSPGDSPTCANFLPCQVGPVQPERARDSPNPPLHTHTQEAE